jgi:hypothetical protein
MKFKEWKEWYKSLPKSFRWFVWLILLRPLIDNFYYLKEISPFLSPLYIVGGLTPIVIFYTIRKKQKPVRSEIDTNFRIWGGFILAGIIMMGFTGLLSLNYWIVIIKISLPIYLFIFLRYFVRNQKDIDGILQTFLYSAILIVGIFAYEIVVQPLNMTRTRGIDRMQGNFADVFNYATYVSLCTLINYYFLLKSDTTLSRSARIRNVVLNIVIGTAMLIKMSHVATDVVFLALNVLYFLVAFKKNAVGALFFVGVLFFIVYSYGKETIDKSILPLIETDVNVYSGEEDDVYLLHGRVGRWERITDIFNQSSLVSQLFGLPYTGYLPFAFITGGVHNDYLRNLLCTGYIGLIAYLLLLYNLFRRIIRHHLSTLYLGLGALGSLVLYSISVTPTVYPCFLYIILAIFAFFAIPPKVLKMQENTLKTKSN